MAQLIKIAGWPGKPRGHVVFVHGLGGHAYDTWRRGADDGTFWPLWLARDIDGLTVWTLSYAAPATNWLGTAPPLQDRAVTMLELLLIEPTLADAPVAFVCHSLGGLVVKQMLRAANDQQARRTEARGLLDRVKAVVFIATPHIGSAHATLLDWLRLVFWPSTAAQDLVRNDANLRNLNVWYRNWSDRIAHRIFYEMEGTAAGTIVDPGSADAGLSGIVPVGIDADHIGICKPLNADDLLYRSTRDFLAKEVFAKPKGRKRSTRPKVPALPAVADARPMRWAPIALRLAVLLCVGFIGFKGIHATIWPVDQELTEQVTKMRQEVTELRQSLSEEKRWLARPAEDALDAGAYKRAYALLTVAQSQILAQQLIEGHQPDRAVKNLREAERRLSRVSSGVSATEQLLLGYLYKTYAQAYSTAGDDAQARQYQDKALKTFEKVKDDPKLKEKTTSEYAGAINGIGNIYHARHRYAEAIDAYQLATRLAPDYAYAWHDMFLAYVELAKGGDVHLEAMRDALRRTKEIGLGKYPDLGPAYIAGLEAILKGFEQSSSSGTHN